VLTVSTSPDFAAKWLVHRLGHFAEAPGRRKLRKANREIKKTPRNEIQLHLSR
jgi:hypothetical protein